MPVFISYSHADSDFAERLALQLVKARASVWIDKWELNVGDSLIDRIQDAVAGASALLVVLSKASVASPWVKKELNAGLVRELEEKRVVVLPVLLEDCDIPVFLREKLYADFRTNFDKGLAAVLKAISRITNDTQSRVDQPSGHVDWGLDWGFSPNGLLRMTLTFVEQFAARPNTTITSVNILGTSTTTQRYREFEGNGLDWVYRHVIVETLVSSVAEKDLRMILTGPKPTSKEFSIRDEASRGGFEVAVDVRLLGDDTGTDVLVDIGGLLAGAVTRFREATRRLTPEELKTVRKLQGLEG